MVAAPSPYQPPPTQTPPQLPWGPQSSRGHQGDLGCKYPGSPAYHSEMVSLGPPVTTPLFQVQGPRSVCGCSSSRTGMSERCCCYSGPGMVPPVLCLSLTSPHGCEQGWMGACGSICVRRRNLCKKNSAVATHLFLALVPWERDAGVLLHPPGAGAGPQPGHEL